MEQYSIYEGHMADLMKKVNKIQNKCKKFGCDFHFAQVGEEFKEVKVDVDPNTGKDIYGIRKFIIVEAEGTAQLNDWEFIASVEHTSKGNIFSKAMTTVEIPERYRTMNPTCEHCNSNRQRKSTFIVHNTVTDEFKMVGNSCLKDFTFGLSVAAATWFASLKHVFEEEQELPISGGSYWHQKYFDTKEVLQYIAETIRHFGYAKTESPDSTRSRFQTLMEVSKGQTRWMDPNEVRHYQDLIEQVGFNPESPEATKMVEEALNWLNGQEIKNDYMHNLKVASDLEYTHSGNFGLLVSLFPTFNRDLERQAKMKEEREKGMMSNHQGKVGERLTINVESVKCITSWESCFDGYHTSTTYVWKITDTNGNIFTWKTSTYLNEDNAPKTIKGTVKEHKIFREVKQTEVTRCKVIA